MNITVWALAVALNNASPVNPQVPGQAPSMTGAGGSLSPIAVTPTGGPSMNGPGGSLSPAPTGPIRITVGSGLQPIKITKIVQPTTNGGGGTLSPIAPVPPNPHPPVVGQPPVQPPGTPPIQPPPPPPGPGPGPVREGHVNGTVQFMLNGHMAKVHIDVKIKPDGVVKGHVRYSEKVKPNKEKKFKINITGAQLMDPAPGLVANQNKVGAAVITGRIVEGDGLGRDIVVHVIDGGSPGKVKDMISFRADSPLLNDPVVVANQVFLPVLKGNIVVHEH